MIELLFELLFEIFGEVILQVVFQALAEAGLHVVRRPGQDRAPASPWLLVIGYALLGALVGGLSLLVFPHSLARSHTARLGILVLAPLATGLSMALIGAWRRHRGQQTLPLDRFAYGCLLGLCTAAVRFVWAQ